MTTAFERFLAQFQAEGREKVDGWVPAHFSDLSEAELQQARELLLQRIWQGDVADAVGIVHIADARVTEQLAAFYDRGQPPGLQRIFLARTLWQLTGADRYLEALFTALDGDDETLASLAANLVGDLEVPAHMAPALVSRLLDGRHETRLLPLTRALLRLAGHPMATIDDFVGSLPLVREIVHAPLHARGVLVRQLLP